ncbi:MAG TPA: universal stress protein [Anaerolineales bacterium]|nr:universal stress protein [Anaerolineales bacterium]
MAYKKILVCLDGSPLAEAAIPHAQILASDDEAEIVLLRVSVDPAAEFSFSDPSIANNFIQDMEAETLSYMQSARSTLQKAGCRTSFLIRQGAVAETILQTASEIKADVMVMSTHGRSGIQRWLLGSVADRIVTHSNIPVMLIRPGTS